MHLDTHPAAIVTTLAFVIAGGWAWFTVASMIWSAF